MTKCKNIFFAVFLLCTLPCNAIATENYNIKIPSTNNELLSESETNINLSPHKSFVGSDGSTANIVGMVIGGGFIGLGILSFISDSDETKNKTSNSNQKICPNNTSDACPIVASASYTEKALESGSEKVGEALGKAILGTICILIGLPIFIYNVTQISSDTDMHDDNQIALKYKKSQKKSVQITVSPTVNLISSGGGINTILRF